MRWHKTGLLVIGVMTVALAVAAQAQRGGAPRPVDSGIGAVPAGPVDQRVAALKARLDDDVESPAMYDLGQQMNDMVFSFGEVGFQEVETQRYLGKVLRDTGFTVEDGVAGIPTAWIARWGTGHRVIALGSDVDGIPQGSQKPGVAYHDPLVEGAPGHGEGHNSGTPLNIVAAIALKRLMERERIPGTLMIFPGIAEELLGTKAHYVRAGLFKDVDAVLYNHVGANLSTGWGDSSSLGLVSLEYTFQGETAHSAAQPWRGRSALDAVELMNVGWNYRREHLRLSQRTHYVVTNGGDQPNVVPRNAGVWYCYRESDEASIRNMWDIGDKMAQGAALMTGTTWTSRILGTAWPRHTNRTLAEVMHANIARVGLPQWSDNDVALAKATQRVMKVPEIGLATGAIGPLRGQERMPDEEKMGGPSDDIGDVTWTVPTVSLSYPANFQAGPGHNWANAIPMATPIAHKGVNAGARVQAATALDLLLRPDLLPLARAYFEQVQLKQHTYTPFLRPDDKPATGLNKDLMDRYRPALKNGTTSTRRRYKTYLDQMKAEFGYDYPTIK